MLMEKEHLHLKNWMCDTYKLLMEEQKEEKPKIIKNMKKIFSFIQRFNAGNPTLQKIKENFPIICDKQVFANLFKEIKGKDLEKFSNNYDKSSKATNFCQIILMKIYLMFSKTLRLVSTEYLHI